MGHVSPDCNILVRRNLDQTALLATWGIILAILLALLISVVVLVPAASHVLSIIISRGVHA
jgi:hypothetical protein